MRLPHVTRLAPGNLVCTSNSTDNDSSLNQLELCLPEGSEQRNQSQDLGRVWFFWVSWIGTTTLFRPPCSVFQFSAASLCVHLQLWHTEVSEAKMTFRRHKHSQCSATLIFCTRLHALIFPRLSNSAGLRGQAISQEKTRPPPPLAGPAEINEPRWASGFGFNSDSNTQTQGIYSRERGRQGSVGSFSLWLFSLFILLILSFLSFHSLCRTTQDLNHCLITVPSMFSCKVSSPGRLPAQRQISCTTHGRFSCTTSWCRPIR